MVKWILFGKLRFLESYDQFKHLYFMHDMECVNSNKHKTKYKNTSKYPRYETSKNVLCLNEDNIPSGDKQILSLFQSLFLFLNKKTIGDSVLLECYEKQGTQGNWYSKISSASWQDICIL